MTHESPSTSQVLTLVAAPPASQEAAERPDNGLTEATLAGVARALADAGAEVGAPDWLSHGRALDLTFAGLSGAQAEGAARAVLKDSGEAGGEARIDIAAQPIEGRRKQLLVADMESTIIAQEMLDVLAERLDLGGHIADVTAKAMAGELDFAAALKERVALLRDFPARELEAAAEQITFTPGAHVLVATMRAHGAYCALVSGGFTHFTARVREAGGFDLDVANTLEVRKGRITGRVVEPIFGREAKLDTLNRLLARRGLVPQQAAAVGDGANDLDMLRAAGLGVAFHGKPKVRAAAPYRIDHGDLTTLLYFQGYRDADFSEP